MRPRFSPFTMMIWRATAFVGVLLVWAQPLLAQQVKVLASVEETTVGAEERVTYNLEIQGAQFTDIQTPQPPATEGLSLLQRTPNTSRNISIVNGNIQQSISFQWVYRPIREGNARFSPAQVRVSGKTYSTEEIALKVVPQSQRPQRRSRSAFDPFTLRPATPSTDQEPPPISSEDIFIRAIPSKRDAFQNEQINIEYRLYFREGIQLRQSRLADSWDAEGFWREELEVESRPIPRTVIENGLRYNTILLKRVAVFPTHAGDLAVDALKIESEGYVPRRFNDPFRSFFSRNSYQPIELASPEIRVNAKPLPKDAPESFTGSVGTFSMTARVSKTEVEVGEAVQLTVTVTGTGNIATLTLPDYKPPGIFEVYDPQVTTNVDKGGSQIRGTKTFTYLLVPRSNGTFELPAAEFTYLDANTRRYKTLRSDPTSIQVTGTATMPLAVATTTAGLPVDDIASLMPQAAAWVALAPTPLHERNWIYVALLLPLLLVAGVYGYRQHATRLATDATYARNRQAHPLARKHLKSAQKLLDDNQARAFYEELEHAVLGFIGNRLNIAERGLTRPVLDERLTAQGVSDETREELRGLLDECDRVRFSPSLPDQGMMQIALNRAGRLIVTLDEAFRTTGRGAV